MSRKRTSPIHSTSAGARSLYAPPAPLPRTVIVSSSSSASPMRLILVASAAQPSRTS